MANGTLAASQIEMLTQSGTGIVTIVPPTTNTNRTLTLPDSTGTLLNTNGGTITGNLTVSGIATLANNAVLGVPSSGTLTNLTGLPLTTGVTGTLPVANGGTGITSFGSGIATFLGTPSSANLIAAITDETGTGALVFANTPTLVTPLLGTPTSGVATYLTGLPLTTGVTGVLPTANGGTNLSSFTANGVVYASSSSALATGSALTFDGTNFGVGTAASYKLHVSGTGTVSSRTYATDATGDASFFVGNNDGRIAGPLIYGSTKTAYGALGSNETAFYSNSSTTIMADGASTVIKFAAGGNTEQMRLNSSGNLGIGTTSPTGKLQVSDAGDVRIILAKTGVAGFDIFNKGTTGTEVGTQDPYSLLLKTNNTVKATLDTSGNLGLGVTPSATNTSYKAQEIGFVGNGLIGFDANDFAMSSGAYYSSSGWKHSATNSLGASFYEQYTGQHLWYNKTAVAHSAGDAITFTQAMTLDASGNLGVGVTPSAWGAGTKALQVSASTFVPSLSYVGGEAFLTHNAFYDGTNWKYTGTGYGSTRYQLGVQGQFVWSTSGNVSGTANTNVSYTDAMTLNASGNLGIGTTSPTAKLNVVGMTTADATINHTVNIGDDTPMASGVGGFILFSGRAGSASNTQFYGPYIRAAKSNGTDNNYAFDLAFGTRPNGGSPTERMRLDSAGNVGVGTSIPLGKLHLSKTGDLAAYKTYSGLGNTGAGDAIFETYRLDGDSNYLRVLDIVALGDSTNNRASETRFFTTNTSGSTAERMRLDSSGNLGIGTTAPATKLNLENAGACQIQIAYNSTNYGRIGRLSSGSYEFASYENGASLVFGTTNTNGATTTRLEIDRYGNAGLGVAPSAWSSLYDALQVGAQGAFWANATAHDFYLSANYLYDGANKYIANGFASYYSQNAGAHIWTTAPNNTSGAGAAISFTQAMTLDSSGRLGIGTTAPSGRLDVVKSGKVTIVGLDTASYAAGVGATLDLGGNYREFGDYQAFVRIAAEKTNGTNTDYGYNMGFYVTTNNGATLGTKAATIDSSGNLFVAKTTQDTSIVGIELLSDGRGNFTVSSNEVLNIKRLASDGNLIRFYQDATEEGNISVSGTTVSYNGGHLSRWAQTTTAKDESIVKGTVLSNLDEMNVYTDSEGNPVDNEQLNKVKVSDVEGDANVAGVFVNWTHDDAHDVDEINMAMTGDMIIRIAQGITVVRGDLLMSAGDGTAKPQGDDIVRSKTVAKVTSTHVTCTYPDGSFCVPCVLMAC